MPQFFRSTAKKPGATKVRKGYKSGGNGDDWIQEVDASIKRRGTKGVCTGKKFGSKSCPPGSKRYNLAKTFKKMGKERKKAATGGRIGLANGGLSHAAGYSPVLGNNRFGYPSGGVPVRNFRGGGAALRGLGRALTKK
jgi:hypothetical protein